MPAHRFTRKANTPKRKREWNHIYESMKAQGAPEGSAIRAASSAIKKSFNKAERESKTSAWAEGNRDTYK